ncbi:MAG: AmmeMemoRadiSam system protein A [Gammaproteobacteria bacterium]|nr:AmmeMemoRadiSam system protein A [Gammaproteobacteria bacterium]
MAPSSCIELTRAEQTLLLVIARDSIHAGLHGAAGTARDRPALPPALEAERGAFVTLTRRTRLRGCIGTIEPGGPLARTVAESAYSAAFRDPRFPQLRPEELEGTSIEISVLTPMEPLAAASREALIAQLRPGVDGLVLQDGRHRSTFLPKVWEQLADPDAFLDQLLAKAALPPDHWSASMRVHRYQTFAFSDT